MPCCFDDVVKAAMRMLSDIPEREPVSGGPLGIPQLCVIEHPQSLVGAVAHFGGRRCQLLNKQHDSRGGLHDHN